MADYIHVDDMNSSTQLCMLLSKHLLHNVFNLDTVELDLICSHKIFHVLIPTFRNDFNALVVRTGGLCKSDLCLVLYECTDEFLINILLNICGTLTVWKRYIKIKVLSLINSWIGRIFFSLNKGWVGELYSACDMIRIALFLSNF